MLKNNMFYLFSEPNFLNLIQCWSWSTVSAVLKSITCTCVRDLSEGSLFNSVQYYLYNALYNAHCHKTALHNHIKSSYFKYFQKCIHP